MEYFELSGLKFNLTLLAAAAAAKIGERMPHTIIVGAVKAVPAIISRRAMAIQFALIRAWQRLNGAAIFFSKKLMAVTYLHIREISQDRGRLARRYPPRSRWYSITSGCSGDRYRFEGHNFWPHPCLHKLSTCFCSGFGYTIDNWYNKSLHQSSGVWYQVDG